MPLEAGRRLGPYEIVAPLGSGGMGEVYRAKDTRLDRTVAVKVLPAEQAQAVEVRQRFEREARAISSLNHPHICALYDVGHENGLAFLVMELVEGQTLAERLAKGPLPTEEVLRLGGEIAGALGAAHRGGIVHRDLKPANVMLTRTGAKLLDFGVARLLEGNGRSEPAEVSSLDTALKPLTGEGAVIGTFQYMAPEQLEGKPVDARADVFALGVVLYEMATGRRAFTGTSRASLAAAILTSEPPPISTVQPLAPPALDRVVRVCLAKDPEARWQNAQDVAVVLSFIADREAERAPSDPSTGRARRFALLGAAALAGALVAGTAVWMVRTPRGHVAPTLKRLSVVMPAGTWIVGFNSPPLALSPDGRRIAFVAGGKLYIREMEKLEARPLDRAEGATTPFFSPDGEWLGFVADGKLKKISLRGGDPRVLCDLVDPRGASWGDGDTIVFASGFSGLSRVSAEGGSPEPLTAVTAEGDVVGHSSPRVLPGGRAALFTISRASQDDDSRDVAVVRFVDRQVKVLVKGAGSPRLFPPRHLLYARGGLVFAAPFDPVSLELTGPATPVLEDVRTLGDATAYFDASASGGLVYVPGYLRGLDRALVFLDRNGRLRPALPSRKPYRDPVLSPDGQRVAAVIEGSTNDDIWVGDLAKDTWQRLTSGGNNLAPLWTPDGKAILFTSNRNGNPNVYWTPSDGSGTPQALTQGRVWTPKADSVSPDGKTVALQVTVPRMGPDVWTVAWGDPASARALVSTAAREGTSSFSPDGRFLAYDSNDSGRPEVYVRALHGDAPRRQVSNRGGSAPHWVRSTGEILYLSWSPPRRMIMSASVAANSDLRIQEPREICEIPPSIRLVSRFLDTTADGQRFLMVQTLDERPAQVVVIPDFREELEARLAATPR